MLIEDRRRTNSIAAATVDFTYDFVSKTPPYPASRHIDQHKVFESTSVCLDSTHPNFFSKNAGLFDNGGFFDLTSNTVALVQPMHFPYKTWGGQYWSGTWKQWGDVAVLSYWNYGNTRGPLVGTLPPALVSESDLFRLGGTAISRCLPTNPAFGLSRSIGELRNDGIPAVVGMDLIKEKSKYLSGTKNARRLGKSSGNEFLNAEFGWLPLVSDLLNLARAVKSSNKILTQYRKQSDTKIRRRYSFPIVTTFAETTKTNFGRCYTTDLQYVVAPNLWPGVQTVQSRNETWFSGAFRYHIPVGDDLSSNAATWESEANKLLGLRLTPKLVWDLAPWTWASSWFASYGDVIKNVSALGADGLAMQYGYIMDSQIITERNDAWFEDSTWNQYSILKPPSASTTYVKKRLRRRAASPYGFGFDMHALSPMQDAILVALGLSHGLR